MFLEFWGTKIVGCSFYAAVKYSLQISSVLLRQNWQLSMVLIHIIFAIGLILRNMRRISSFFFSVFDIAVAKKIIS